ncbi:MAG: peptide MFS transporter [Muribaculaceae bacterium]|jgi:POT family proton-dependent oligopeptide transporter|nr:peptide MFS transporter [Muribaculaceae bacterium]
MFKGHPKGLYALALSNTGERFGYYTMLAVFALFLRENFGLEAGTAGAIYSTFLGLVYFMPLIGGVMADKFGFGKMVTIGISIMFVGYMLLSFPLGGDMIAMIAMMAALLFISLGTGLFKGNLQVMVGDLYNDPKYADKRDSGFSLFYMAINVGSLFAPTTAVGIKNWAQNDLGYSSNDAYHFAFAVACVALVVSIIIYYAFRSTFRHVEGGKKNGAAAAQVNDTLTPAETKQRIVALCLVFAVVIFFWMAFHQNGLTLTYFADEFTNTTAFGFDTMLFDVWNLVMLIVAVYATFSIFQSTSAKGKLTSGVLATGILAFLVYRAFGAEGTELAVSAPIFQQFNPFYVVALTPVSMAIFGSLAKSGKEPSAPRKIAYGMLVAAIGFAIMAVGSQGLNTPNDQARAIAVNKAETIAKDMNNAADDAALKAAEKAKSDFEGKLTKENKEVFETVYNASMVTMSADSDQAQVAAANAELEAIKADTKEETRTSPYWLIFTYLILTFAELLLSPMGISFVSKVAPPKLKGLMMGGWFVATAIGNMLVAVGGFLWAGIPLWSVWAVFISLCLLSALFMFIMMKRLESVTK